MNRPAKPPWPTSALRPALLLAALLLLAIVAAGWFGYQARKQMAALVRGHEAWTARIDHLELLSRLADALSQPGHEVIATGDVATAHSRLQAGRRAFDLQLALVQSELHLAAASEPRQRELSASLEQMAAAAKQMHQAADEICRLVSTNQLAQAAARQEPLDRARDAMHRQVRWAMHRLSSWQQQELAEQARQAEQTQPFEYVTAVTVLLLTLAGCLAARRLISAWRRLEQDLLARTKQVSESTDTATTATARLDAERAAWAQEQERASRCLQAVEQILAAPGDCQSPAASGGVEEPNQSHFAAWLRPLVDLAESQQGLLLQVQRDGPGQPYLRFLFATCPASDWQSFALRAQLQQQGGEIHNLNSLLGSVLATAAPVLANQPSLDSRRGGLPAGHPALANFAGLPLWTDGQLVGLVGLANRPDGYDPAQVQWLQPALAACAAQLSRWQLQCELQSQTANTRHLQAVAPRLHGRRILLLAADREVVRQTRTWLLEAGMEVVCLERATQIVAALRQAIRSECPFDLVAIDYDDLRNDLSTVARMREQEPCPPWIAITSRQLPEDRDLALSQGFSEYLLKPLTATQLWTALDRHLPAPATPPARDPSQCETPLVTLPRTALPPQPIDGAMLPPQGCG